jgi:tRNA dimethylallyltransferase
MQIASKSPLIAIIGPTASGKTRLGVEMAKQFAGEIISADSRQVFCGMDIGTGKDLDEYGEVPHHLIDIAQPGEEYNLYRFAEDFSEAFNDITQKQKLPFLVGGTGMYLDAVLRRYELTKAPIDQSARASLQDRDHQDLIDELKRLNPNQHNETDTNDKQRTIRAIEILRAEQEGADSIHWPAFKALTIGLQFPRGITRQRISQRLKSRLEEGMIEEVNALLEQGVSHAALEHYGLEYRYLSLFLRGELTYNDMFQKLQSAIHQFAKQQEKWFRNIEKKGVDIFWLDTSTDIEAQCHERIESFLREFDHSTI